MSVLLTRPFERIGADSSGTAVEAINGLIQAAKRRARGYRTTKNLINMA